MPPLVSSFFLHLYLSTAETLPEYADHIVGVNDAIDKNRVANADPASSLPASRIPSFDPAASFPDLLQLLVPESGKLSERTSVDLPPRFIQRQRLTDLYPGIYRLLKGTAATQREGIGLYAPSISSWPFVIHLSLLQPNEPQGFVLDISVLGAVKHFRFIGRKLIV